MPKKKLDTDISGLGKQGWEEVPFLTRQCLPVVNSTLFDTIL